MNETKLRCALCRRDLTGTSREWFAKKPYCLDRACLGRIAQPVQMEARLIGTQTRQQKGAK